MLADIDIRKQKYTSTTKTPKPEGVIGQRQYIRKMPQ